MENLTGGYPLHYFISQMKTSLYLHLCNLKKNDTFRNRQNLKVTHLSASTYLNLKRFLNEFKMLNVLHLDSR